MGGKPAARQGDMTREGADIVKGSAGVLIGAPTGVACSVCPTGEATPKYGNPVNPLLGAKVLPGETDVALPTAVHPFPRLQQLPDQDTRAGGRVWSRLESALRYPLTDTR
ncbi:type IV secretion protein Rhs [Escherichia coli]|nr:type IV secretion protein Rhs [Escherichia coli]GDN86961.1 type IV secretion protein Rhs [Escherichia coli]GDW60323.1 type IV secretion protein Rhs [Escherichia coli]